MNQGNQIGFEHILQILQNLLIFPMVNTFHKVIAGLKKTRLLKFPPPCKVNLSEENQPLTTCAFPSHANIYEYEEFSE